MCKLIVVLGAARPSTMRPLAYAVLLASMIDVACASQLFAMCNTTAICSLNRSTAQLSLVGPPLHGVAFGQQISAIDSARRIFWSIGVDADHANNHALLIGVSLTTGAEVRRVQLPISATASFALGFGIMVDVVPATGDVLVCGRPVDNDTSFLGHQVHQVDFASGDVSHPIAWINDSMADAIPQSGSALDADGGVWYVQLLLKRASATAAIVAFDVRSRSTHNIIRSSRITQHNVSQHNVMRVIAQNFTSSPPRALATMLFDAGPPRRIVGFGALVPAITAPRSADDIARFWQHEKAGHTNEQGFIRTLAAFDVATEHFSVIGMMDRNFVVADSHLQTLDVDQRQHIALMQRTQPPPQAWTPSASCKAEGRPCNGSAGEHCCADPGASGTGTGACYRVSRCDAIHDGGTANLSAPFHIVLTDLGNASTLSASPPLCSVAAGDCPLSIEMCDRCVPSANNLT